MESVVSFNISPKGGDTDAILIKAWSVGIGNSMV